jgi:chemotaxis family two-component system response regulator Rcp1
VTETPSSVHRRQALENQPPLVLQVDDDIDDHTMLQIALRRAGLEWNLQFASDSGECFRHLDERPQPRLVLLDLNLPKVDGWQILAQIRDHQHWRMVPVIIYSTAFDQTYVDRAYASGANAYLAKPDTIAILIDQLTAIDRFWFKQASLPTWR